MGAVGKVDRYCAPYSFSRKTLVMEEGAVFRDAGGELGQLFHAIQAGNSPTKSHQLQYRKKIMLQLIGNNKNVNAERRDRPSYADDHERLQKIPHFIAKAASGHTKVCMVCSTEQNRKTTVFYCETCSRRPGLHSEQCFKEYHTKKDYKR